MKKVKTKADNENKRSIRPALTPEARQARLCALAEDVAEQQLLDGTASSQVITHYLKLASSRERLECEKMEKEIEALEAKIESLKSAKRIEELYVEAIDSMKLYSGRVDEQ